MQEPLIEVPKAQVGEKKGAGKGKPRVIKANREQMEMRIAALDGLVAEDHRVRIVWAMAQSYDLSAFYERIDAVEGEAGRPAIDPMIMVALWLYATTEGVGSARELERLCQEHIVYQWIMGGVSVNYHTLADFRVGYEKELDEILTKSVAVLMSEGMVKLERTAQDGVRIRASAGSSSFRRKRRLEGYLEEAQGQVKELKEQGQKEREEISERTQAARRRAARERVERVEKALKEIEQVQEVKDKSHKKKSERTEARSSTTDPEARVMKMADGGFRPAYNGEFSTDVESGIVVGVEATHEIDQEQMEPMLAQMEERYNKAPDEHLVDGGFATPDAIEAAFERGVQVYAPVKQPRAALKDPTQSSRAKAKSPGVNAWEERMKTEEAKKIYQQRSATSEWVNAQARNRGMQKLVVRGTQKVKSILLWFALVHNLWVSYRLHQQTATAVAGGC
jgi:transposase